MATPNESALLIADRTRRKAYSSAVRVIYAELESEIERERVIDAIDELTEAYEAYANARMDNAIALALKGGADGRVNVK